MSAQDAATDTGSGGRDVFHRPVAPTEWSYLAAARRGGLLVIQLVVEGDGAVDALALSRAVAAASQSCPGARLVRRGRTWVDGGDPARVVVVDGRHFDRTKLTGVPGLTVPLDGAEGRPNCEVLLLTGEPGTVVFRASHAVMDFKGVAMWAAEVFRVLRDEPPHGATGTLADHTLLDMVGRTGQRPPLRLDQRSPLGGRPGNDRVWRRRTPAGRHPALAAKVAAAVAGAVPGPTARIMVPVDLRRHAPEAASTANLALPVFLDIPAGEGADTVHRRLLGALASRRELAAGAEAALARLPLPAAAALLGASRAAATARHRYLASAIVSNGGRLAPADYSTGEFTATSVYALPVHAPLVPVSIALLELPDRTELVVSAQGAEDAGARCEDLLDRVESALGSATPAARATPIGPPRECLHSSVVRPKGGPGGVWCVRSQGGGGGVHAVGAPPAPEGSRGTSATDDNAAWGHLPCPKGYGGGGTSQARALGEGAGHHGADGTSKTRPTAPGAAELLLAPGPGGLPPLDTTVVQLLRARAARRPDAAAVLGEGLRWSYADLDRRSDAVAARLLARGVGRGEVVGVLADRSALGLAGVWGVLKAGAAFMPIDVRNPVQRVEELLADAKARFCLRETAPPGRTERSGCTTLLLEDAARDEPALDEAQRAALMAAAPGPDDLAYVIHTSGSTGRPKGVQTEHRSLANVVGWAAPVMRCDEETRAAYSFSPGFDFSILQIFPPLVHGGAVVPVPGELDHVKLREMLSGRRINTLGLTPTHLDLAARLGIRPTGIRALQVGGETLTAAGSRRARDAFGPDCLFVNIYGPTETTVACTIAVIDGSDEGDGGTGRPSAPIGVPVHRTSVAVLDQQGNEVPDGEPGELHVTGVQLARGYLGRPDLTADRFVHLPDGRRAYRTGDLVLRLPDGRLEHTGRIDTQIKIRGHRVEPAEVEAALTALPSIGQCAVVARPRPGSGVLALCAFVVPAGDAGGGIDEAAVRERLAQSLPPHLVPSSVRTLPRLPETAGGKTDRRALPNPFAPAAADQGRSVVTEGPAMPRAAVVHVPTPHAEGVEDGEDSEGVEVSPGPGVAAVTARIWARVLRCDAADLGSSSDFHALGGDSLAVLEMLAALGEELLGESSAQQFLDRLGPFNEKLTLGRVVETVEALRDVS